MNSLVYSQKKIALFGIFRSGTNFTRTIMEWNYDCRLVTDEYGWKHGYFPVLVERSKYKYQGVDVMFVTKNPFSAISSLFKYYTRNGRNIVASKDWKQFLRKRFVIYDSFQENSPQYRFANVVEFWNSMNWNYASIGAQQTACVHVKYEDLLEAPFLESLRIAKKLDLCAKYAGKDDFRIPDRVTRNMGDKVRISRNDYLTDRPFSGVHYKNREYLLNYDTEDLLFVCQSLDQSLVEQLGYKDDINIIRSMIKS